MHNRLAFISVLLLFSGCGSSDDDSDTLSQVPITETVNIGDYQLLAVNDLGMHCADLDYQVFSILPPFNVLHAQVIRKGFSPSIMTDADIEVTYQAIDNSIDDPSSSDPSVRIPSITTSSANTQNFSKSNFWDAGSALVPTGLSNAGLPISIGGEAYAELYPGLQLAKDVLGVNLDSLCADPATPYGCPSLLTTYEPLPDETGLPVPNLEIFLPNDASVPVLMAHQQSMPGVANTPQAFAAFTRDQVFFPSFDFGAYLRERNWFAAEGIPILPIDDRGISNPYPVMRVKAHDRTSRTELAYLDVVLPVASEADCQNCHVQELDCSATADLPFPEQCNGSAVDALIFEVMTLDDNPPGITGLNQLQNTAKINILRLHDARHGHRYQQWDANNTLVSTPCDPAADALDPSCLANQTPLNCARCHYTPALDLTQSGPVNEPEQGPHGRQQRSHKSMSNVMHAFHGRQVYPANSPQAGTSLFPDMPSANDPLRTSGAAINSEELALLNQTCYQCHPGKSTECLRGSMYAGGVVCQDCHGDMDQVGNDFSIRVSSTNPGDFILDGSLRIPWATEPGCQSCHTGDALNRNHPVGAIVADDGIRLLQAYSDSAISVTGISGTVETAAHYRSRTSRFSENTAVNEKGGTVDVLYRLSTDTHGGVKCEGCHNSTHAIWPNQNPYANDNIAAQQLQGHSGTLGECGSCHRDQDLGNTLGGPHGMHPVGGGRFANGGHEGVFKSRKSDCQACHGVNGEGTVLSRAFNDRSFLIEECEHGSLCPGGEVEPFTVNIARGEPVSCTLCHENYMLHHEDDD